MWHAGIDLHRRTVVIAAVNDSGRTIEPVTLDCRETSAIVEHLRSLRPFRAVIEATASYRWLYDLLATEGTMLLAHPAKLRLMIQRRAKTDRLDCQLLANLLRINQIPLAYVPPPELQQLRELTRQRARLVRFQSQATIGLRALLARHNVEAPFHVPFGPRGIAWFLRQTFGEIDDLVRDELLLRIEHYRREVKTFRSTIGVVASEVSPGGRLTRSSRRRHLHGPRRRRGTGRGRPFPLGETGRRLHRPDLEGQPIGRSLLLRLHHSTRSTVVALDLDGDGHWDRSSGRGTQEHV